MVKSLIEVNKNHETSYQTHIKNIHNFKNNLKNFAIDEKRKIDDSFKQLNKVINDIYQFYMQDMNELIESLNLRFDSVLENVESLGKNNQTGKILK